VDHQSGGQGGIEARVSPLAFVREIQFPAAFGELPLKEVELHAKLLAGEGIQIAGYLFDKGKIQVLSNAP